MDLKFGWKNYFKTGWIAHPYFYRYFVYCARKCKKHLGKLIDLLNKFILKGYQFKFVMISLNIVFISINLYFVITKYEENSIL